MQRLLFSGISVIVLAGFVLVMEKVLTTPKDLVIVELSEQRRSKDV